MLTDSNYNEIIALAKQTDHFKKLHKPYRKVEGYLHTSEVATQLAFLIVGGEQMPYKDWTQDPVAFACIISAKLVENFPTPFYWLDRNLMSAFISTDLPDNICDVSQVIPHAIIMLPEIIKNPDGFYLDWLFIHHLEKDGVLPEFNLGDRLIHSCQVEAKQLRWCTILRGGHCYSSKIEIKPEESAVPVGEEINVYSLGEKGNDIEITSASEKDFVKQVDNLVTQLLLYWQMKPEAISEEKLPPITKGVGFGHPQKQLLNPVWIGRGYKSASERSTPTSIHASPRMHWRRGHWTRRAVGKREENLRKWVWIEPVLVNG